MSIQRTENDTFYFVRKPYGIPTTFGSQFSFLEQIEQEKPVFLDSLKQYFTREEEYGLVNRLDNDTEWFIYFAKNPSNKELYTINQQSEVLHKIYLCAMQGKVDIESTVHKNGLGKTVMMNDLHIPWQTDTVSAIVALCDNSIVANALPNIHMLVDWLQKKSSGIILNLPIMHHIYMPEKMIVVKTSADMNKWRGNQQPASTFFWPLYYDEIKNITWVCVSLAKWVRHQIRVHANALWYPLVGDVLYNKKCTWERLHLRSIGMI